MTDTHSSCKIVHSKKKHMLFKYLSISYHAILPLPRRVFLRSKVATDLRWDPGSGLRWNRWNRWISPLLGAWENVGIRIGPCINGSMERVNLQENSIFDGKIPWVACRFSLKPIQYQSIVGNARVSQMESQISPPPAGIFLRTSPVTCCTRSVLAYEQQIFGRLLWEL